MANQYRNLMNNGRVASGSPPARRAAPRQGGGSGPQGPGPGAIPSGSGDLGPTGGPFGRGPANRPTDANPDIPSAGGPGWNSVPQPPSPTMPWPSPTPTPVPRNPIQVADDIVNDIPRKNEGGRAGHR